MLAPNELAALIDETGYPVLMDSYGPDPLTYEQFVEVLPVAGTNLYGEKLRVLQAIGRFKKRRDGEHFAQDTPLRGPTAQLAIHPYGESFEIPRRLLEANNAKANVVQIVQEHMTEFGRKARLTKEDFVADMFQKGTLTAGSLEFFDNSFPDNDDPNAGVIYDGLPWFDTAHTITGGSTTFANHIASAALSSATLQTALDAMENTNAKDERNDRVEVRPTHLVVPTGLRWTADVILNSTLIPGSAQNDRNSLQGRLQPITWRALDDAASAAAWWVVDAANGSGVRVRDSGAPVIRMAWDEERGVMLVTAEYYFGAAVRNWRFAHANNKAAA